MTDSPVTFSQGLPETRLPGGPADVVAAIDSADPAGVEELVAAHPRVLEGWARLGELAEAAHDAPVTAYAYFRVGYHRGLDALRQAGWRGSGFVRWDHAGNRGFLRCLDGLRRQAEAIGEADEAERCAIFLAQLDPDRAR